MYCWKCHHPLPPDEKILFRSSCTKCGSDLHCCAGCTYYSPGKPNDCLVPHTEWVRDREALNYCEDFKIKDSSFRKEPEEKKGFDSLFKDDL